MRDIIKKIVEDNNGHYISRRITESYFKKNNIEIFNRIQNIFDDSISFVGKLYLIYYGINTIPKCKICGKTVKFKKFSQGFSKYCSMKCIGNDKNVQIKRENSFKKKYGHKYTLQSKVLRDKITETNIKKYGTPISQQSDIVKMRTIFTNNMKYGVNYPQQLEEIRNKSKQTNIKKYGFENPNQSEIVKNKSKQTNIMKYGFESPNQSEIVKNKIKITNFNKYGDEFIFNVDEIKNKIYSTNILRYGNKIPSKNKIVIDKIITSNIKTKRNIEKIFWSKKLNLNPEDIEYVDNDTLNLKNYCDKHNQFTITIPQMKNRLHQQIENICTICYPISEQSSIKELEVKNFIINELNIVAKKTKIDKSEIDIYIPSHNLGIEFDGLYYHSNKFKTKNYHLNKTNTCELNNIQLLHIFEDEWVYKRDIVKSIIKSKLGIVDNKIYARKTEIMEISDNTIIRNFLNNNHLQGFIGSNVKIGLFYNNELVSLMTFGKKRIAMGNKQQVEGDYEMLRYCNKLNTQVVGGASRLLKYFINNYQPKSILTFADRRYSNGNLYKQLGFNFIGNTELNYWYFKTNDLVRHHRFGFRKDVLVKQGFDALKTEHQIMEERNYYHIYDSGNMTFKLLI